MCASPEWGEKMPCFFGKHTHIDIASTQATARGVQRAAWRTKSGCIALSWCVQPRHKGIQGYEQQLLQRYSGQDQSGTGKRSGQGHRAQRQGGDDPGLRQARPGHARGIRYPGPGAGQDPRQARSARAARERTGSAPVGPAGRGQCQQNDDDGADHGSIPSARCASATRRRT